MQLDYSDFDFDPGAGREIVASGFTSPGEAEAAMRDLRRAGVVFRDLAPRVEADLTSGDPIWCITQLY